jgi:hypothetical protein
MPTPLVAVAWGGADNPRAAWSGDDAASWTTVNLPTFANGSGSSWSGLAYSPKLGMFVAIASGGDNNSNNVARSTDNGHSWTATAVPNTNSWTMNGICWAGHLGLFVAVTSAGPTTSTRVLTSPDGINWTARVLPDTGIALNSVCWSSDLGLLVAVGDNNAIYTSPDAVNWTKATAPATSKNWRFIAWAGGAIQKFCMIAGNASGNNDYACCSDPTAAAWSQKSLTGSAYDWQSIAYSPGLDMLMVVGGNTGVIARSTDGVNYTQLASGLGGTRFDHACWSDAGSWLVIGANTLYMSPNGVAWTAGTPPSSLSWHRLVATNALPLAGNLRAGFSDGAALAADSHGIPIPPGTHFYWRVYIESNQGDSYTSVGEIYMRTAPGGADLCVGGTALESGHSGSDVAANAFNRTEGNRWATVGSSGIWVGYRFPIRQRIVEFALKADTSYLTQVPKRFWLEWSDDGVNWRTAVGAVNEVGWSNLQTRTFTKPELVDGAAETWGLRCLDKMSSGAFGSADYVEIQELEFRDASGVDLTDAGGGTAIESSHNSSYVAASAFDNNPGTRWQAGANGKQYVGYAFPSAVAPTMLTMRAQNTSEYNLAPLNFDVLISHDGEVFGAVLAVPTLPAWTQNLQRAFDLAGDGTPLGPYIDGQANANFSGTAAGNVSLTTTQPDDLIIAIVHTETTGANGYRPVGSVTDAASLSWQRRAQYQWAGGRNSNSNTLEIWWAHAPAALTANTITAHISGGNVDDATILAFGVAGADINEPFDTNASLPATATGGAATASTPSLAGVSTDAARALILAAAGSPRTGGTSSSPADFTTLANFTNSGGTDWSSQQSQYKLATGMLSNATVAFGTSFTIQNWGLIVDAIKAPAAGIPPLELTAALAEDAVFEAAITIILAPLELAAAFADEARLAPTIGIWPPLHLTVALGEDAAFAAAITVLPAPLHLAVDLADGAALAVYLTVGAAALRLAANFADEAVLAAHPTLFVAIALTAAFTDDAELAAPVTIGFQPHAPPIQVVVVLSW